MCTKPDWMDVAKAEMGIAEVPGTAANPRIIEYLSTCGGFRDDETAWCSAFVNWTLQRAGYLITKRANARSWLAYGHDIKLPGYGAITVFWRTSPRHWQGHVGFYLREEASRICVLGGNQGNRVCESWYDKSRLLGYRWPVRG